MQRTSRHLRSWLRLLACGGISAAALIGAARADDSEIYISQSTAAPNIMLILDTSGSMGGSVTTQDPYVPSRDYIAAATGDCANIRGRVFYKTSSQGTPAGCNSSNYVAETDMRCSLATPALASSAGSYPGDRFVQWRSGNGGNAWRAISGGNHGAIDCRKDASPYPDKNGSGALPAYSTNENNSIWQNNADGGSAATLYSANYVAYYAQFRNAVTSTRLRVMQQAATNLLNAISNVNVGLMRYSSNTSSTNSGGMVMAPVAPIAQNREQLINIISNFVADGNTPLSETLFEAHQYFTGGRVDFGNTSRGCYNDNGTQRCEAILSVPSSRSGGLANSPNYLSPATESCQKNFIVYLTDGEPTSDTDADTKIRSLPQFSSTVATTCGGGVNCLGALSEYLFKKDLRSTVMGEQNITSYYIGFGSAFGGSTSDASFQFLIDAATRGGGEAYKAGDLSELSEVFTNIFNAISSNSSTMTAPTVAVNAFNRTRTLNDLYISVFQPKAGIHWPGNIKKYQIDPDDNITLLARGGVDAIGNNGYFMESTSDYWSATNADGAKVEFGGAARQIPTPVNRNVYTHIGNNPSGTAGVVLSGNVQKSVVDTNTLITDAVLGTNATADPLRTKLISWARGADVNDVDGDAVLDEQRFDMGDPMHSQPAVVIYGGTTTNKNPDDAVVFTATNDGYLHAFETTTGTELWSFIPQEMLPKLKELYDNPSSASKNYLIDGDVRVLKFDVNGDGVVDASNNDRVLLFFSTGRNRTTSRYFALDVTSKTAPRFLWSIGPDQLPGLGQAWSRPTVTRVNISAATQNSQKLVLVFGGGYDPLEEAGSFVADTDVGNRVFIVDALRGTLLWSAGDDGTDLRLPRMTHAIPSPVNVVDLDGDSFADRLYVGDMAAQLWRFDIYNGKTRAELVTGGVIASLGAKDETPRTAANTRRFYNAPDAALMQGTNSPPFINVAIGSGYRGHPLVTSNQDRFYAIRDYQPFVKLTQAQYTSYSIIRDTDLEDITTNFAPELSSTARGWKLQLNYPSYRGEKVLSSSSTLQNTLFFTTYTPSASSSSNTCSVAVGSNRAYAISAMDGSPIPRRDGSTDPNNPDPNNPNPDPPSAEDRYAELSQTGIAPEVTVLFPDDNQITCLSGVEVLSVCRDFNSRLKTYWHQTNAN